MAAPAGTGISIKQIERVLGLEPVQRPLPRDIAIVVRNGEPVAFFRVSAAEPVDPSVAEIEKHDPAFVSRLFGYAVRNGNGEFYTANGRPDSTTVLCFRPTEEYDWLEARGELIDHIPEITEAIPRSPRSSEYEMNSRPGQGTHNFIS